MQVSDALLLQYLKTFWGTSEFRPMQKEIVQSVLEGHDTLVLLPTGGGKSLCYQLPVLASKSLALVISPLVSLMNDQVESLKKKNILSYALHAFISRKSHEVALENAYRGACRFLFVSPEKLQSQIFLNEIRDLPVWLIAVDEAHCISQWGHDFRPSYRRLDTIRSLFPEARCLALTASATPRVCQDIMSTLGFSKDARVFRQSFFRKNIFIHVDTSGSYESGMLQALKDQSGNAVIYFRNRKKTELFARFLKKHGFRAAPYHAGMSKEIRDAIQREWMEGKTPVICATTAFGMGIDKPDVRVVLHPDIPESPEAWYQEIGRAGRDGKPSMAVLFADASQTAQLNRKWKEAFPEIDYLREVMNHLYNYFQIAMGSGAFFHAPFELEKFSSAYGLNINACYYAINLLEKLGLLKVHDVFRYSSEVQMLYSSSDLYDFQVRYPQHEPLIKALLRNYSGILHFSVGISEYRLASLLRKTPYDIKKQLELLHSLKILSYYPKNEHPSLEILADRVPREQIYFPIEVYQALKENAKNRLDAMINIVSGHECINKSLMQYFGEMMSEDCGICSVCFQKYAHGKLINPIREFVQQHPRTKDEVENIFPVYARKWVVSALKELYEKGILMFRNGKFYAS